MNINETYDIIKDIIIKSQDDTSFLMKTNITLKFSALFRQFRRIYE